MLYTLRNCLQLFFYISKQAHIVSTSSFHRVISAASRVGRGICLEKFSNDVASA